jgi:hypothetical protein
MKERETITRLEPIAVRGKWFDVNDVHHSAADARLDVESMLMLGN